MHHASHTICNHRCITPVIAREQKATEAIPFGFAAYKCIKMLLFVGGRKEERKEGRKWGINK